MDTMKISRLVLLLVVGVCALGTPQCVKAPPSLSPEATRAFYGTQVIHDLDRLRDVAVAAHETTPPLLSAQETLAVVKWHQAAIVTVHAAPAGWRSEITVGLDQAAQQLSPKAKQTVAPYIAIVKSLLREIP